VKVEIAVEGVLKGLILATMIPPFRLSTTDPQADWPWGDNRDNQLPLTVKTFRLHDVADFVDNCLCADEIQFDSHARLRG